MMDEAILLEMARRLREIREATERLKQLAEEHRIPAVFKNAERILACVAMLELHIQDPLKLLRNG